MTFNKSTRTQVKFFQPKFNDCPRGGQIDTNIDTNVGIGIDRYQRENIDT